MLTECRMCNGKGVTGPVHINHGDAPHEWRDSMPCLFCEGTGKWSAERLALYREGQQHRHERVLRGESMMECAKRIGVRPSDLSAYETGRRALPAGRAALAKEE